MILTQERVLELLEDSRSRAKEAEDKLLEYIRRIGGREASEGEDLAFAAHNLIYSWGVWDDCLAIMRANKAGIIDSWKLMGG